MSLQPGRVGVLYLPDIFVLDVFIMGKEGGYWISGADLNDDGWRGRGRKALQDLLLPAEGAVVISWKLLPLLGLGPARRALLCPTELQLTWRCGG